MSELSKLLGTAGPPHQLVHEGRTFTFHLIDQTRKSAWEKRLYQNAREGVYVDRDRMSEEQYLKRLDAVRERYELGEFAIFGKYGKKVLETEAGALLLLEIITGESSDDLVPLLAARGEEASSLIKTVMNESFKRVKPKAAAPNG